MSESLLPTSPTRSASTRIGAGETVATTQRSWLVEPLTLLYAATLFASAFLLFWLQPLVAKMLLPRLGGAPAVWNTALMFFQVVLLAGYLYAHLLIRYLAPKAQPWVHATVIFVAFTCLPLGIATAAPASDEAPALWLVRTLALSVGLPFFALSASAPLLQAWFARTGHRHAQDPYFLYGASNLGSLVALLGFPVLFEPWLTVAGQSRLWMLIFLGFAALLAGCALWSPRGAPAEAAIVPATPSAASSRAAAPWRERLLWIALAFVPSSLLLGVTSFITTDVASAPLLWIAPLALYLLSFVVTFARRPLLPTSWSLAGQAGAIAIVLLLLPLPAPSLAFVIVAHFAAFFLTALVCHGTLAARRPAASRLTEFYICMSLGGALGGIANALIAPLVFSGAYEYPLALLLACLLRQAASTAPQRPGWRDIVAPLGLFAIVLAILLGWEVLGRSALPLQAMGLLLPPLSVVFFRGNGLRFGLAVAAVMVPFMVAHNSPGLLHQERSFFGVYRVKTDPSAPAIDLIDGTVLHGAEATDPAHWRDELSYYDPAGPIGQYFTALHAASSGPQRIGVIGLGTGALACYAQPGENWSFYEIDPAVLRLAQDKRYFHYLEQCGADDRVILGDARVSLTREPAERYDTLVLDAFSSDAIPMHLLTREALQLYLDKLGAHGTILMHISNSHLQLWPMLDALARQLGLATRHQLFMPTPAQIEADARASEWLAFARTDADLAFLDGTTPGWKNEHPGTDVVGWSDDFSNLLSVIRW
ncbi:MAG TPA: fused MFS/spermidine synthase [Stellaceae bacterium]